ncbi:MAG: SDR family NAD(P)-dependent oxidoreductase [Gammaproteobacteria bacterium]
MHRVALITGGNSGIGNAVAKKLISLGYYVYISGSDPRKTKQAALALGAEAIIADLRSLESIECIAAPFSEKGLDVLINNAAIVSFLPIDMLSEQSFDDHFHVNVRSPLFLIKALLKPLEKRKAAVTNISSVISQCGVPGFSVYAATKGAIEAVTRNLAIELAPRCIRVNAVCPGAIDTPIFSKMGIPEDQLETTESHIASSIPLQRFGTPEEVADVVVAQVEASYVTGAVWHVDGGVSTVASHVSF